MKNPHALTSIAADRLPTRLRYGLTGTPMMNDYDELFHLVNLIVPGRLGSSSEFQTRFEEPMKRGMKKNASSEQVAKVSLSPDTTSAFLRMSLVAACAFQVLW